MPRRPKSPEATRANGTKQLSTAIAAEVRDQLDRFARERGETLRTVVETALRRHFAQPPPPPAPPEAPPYAAGE